MSEPRADASSTRDAVRAGLRVLQATGAQPLQRFLTLGADALIDRLTAWPALMAAAPFTGLEARDAVFGAPAQSRSDEPRARPRVTAPEAASRAADAGAVSVYASVERAKSADGAKGTAPVLSLRAIAARGAVPAGAREPSVQQQREGSGARRDTEESPLRVALRAVSGGAPRAAHATAPEARGPHSPCGGLEAGSGPDAGNDDEHARLARALVETRTYAEPIPIASGEASPVHERRSAPAVPTHAGATRSLATIASLARACMRDEETVPHPAGEERRARPHRGQAPPAPHERARKEGAYSQSTYAGTPHVPRVQSGTAALDGEDAGLLLAELLNAHLLAEARRHGVDLS
jgi:hypothetical protein